MRFSNICTNLSVISRKIRPLAASTPPGPPPHIKIALYITALSGRWGRYANAYGICAPSYCISLKKIYEGGGYSTARGLVSNLSVSIIHQNSENIFIYLNMMSIGCILLYLSHIYADVVDNILN